MTDHYHSHQRAARVQAWFRRLWATLMRDPVADQRRAKELLDRRIRWSQVADPTSWDTLPGEGSDSPENSPEAVRPESRKSK